MDQVMRFVSAEQHSNLSACPSCKHEGIEAVAFLGEDYSKGAYFAYWQCESCGVNYTEEYKLHGFWIETEEVKT